MIRTLMLCIIGLGNAGEQYKNSRHNVGWMALDELRRQYAFSEPVHRSDCASGISKGRIGDTFALLIYPDALMNESGHSVRTCLSTVGQDDDIPRIILVHDDMDIALGKIKISHARGAAGHNGVKSITSVLNNKNLTRVRIGISFSNSFPLQKELRAGNSCHDMY